MARLSPPGPEKPGYGASKQGLARAHSLARCGTRSLRCVAWPRGRSIDGGLQFSELFDHLCPFRRVGLRCDWRAQVAVERQDIDPKLVWHVRVVALQLAEQLGVSAIAQRVPSRRGDLADVQILIAQLQLAGLHRGKHLAITVQSRIEARHEQLLHRWSGILKPKGPRPAELGHDPDGKCE